MPKSSRSPAITANQCTILSNTNSKSSNLQHNLTHKPFHTKFQKINQIKLITPKQLAANSRDSLPLSQAHSSVTSEPDVKFQKINQTKWLKLITPKQLVVLTDKNEPDVMRLCKCSV